jgi:hypothetical protein
MECNKLLNDIEVNFKVMLDAVIDKYNIHSNAVYFCHVMLATKISLPVSTESKDASS